MCLSTVFELVGNEEKKVCEYVSSIKANDSGEYIFTDILGSEIKIKGTLKSLDFINNKIVIEA